MADSYAGRSILMDKFSFVQKLGMLTKATADDETPVSGYLYQEINKMTFESGSFCHDLLDYLVDRLEDRSYHVKLKVLNIIKFVVENGHPDFRRQLRKKSRGIKEAEGFSGPADPLHGATPYQMIRKTAKEVNEILFDVESEREESPNKTNPSSAPSSAMYGMGSQGGSPGKMQGFGNTPNKPQKSIGDSIIGGIIDIAESLVEPDSSRGGPASPSRSFGNYKPVQLENDRQKISSLTKTHSSPRRQIKERKPGVAGGGWEDEETEEDVASLQTSEKSSDSMDLADRLASVTTSDWSQEQQLLSDLVVNIQKPIPKRDEINTFIKRCSKLNCDKILEFLNDKLMSSENTIVVRSLVLLEYLMRSDLVQVDLMTTMCHKNLIILNKNNSCQSQIKARKVILQLQKLSSQGHLFAELDDQQGSTGLSYQHGSTDGGMTNGLSDEHS
ncbi:AP-4 complex accessory subunit tepsin-like [Lineus longissimus]|uniref:AP-4 complex accessory subunit tepsin-like n=1 Tax=Lineus longissimus TaxID=88925 RepID=UPI002B4D20F6